jgi:Iron-sulfur cluster-binding domain
VVDRIPKNSEATLISERIDAITKITEKYLGPIIPAPKSVKIELTANCNFRCGFCVKSLRPDNGEMDRVFYSRIIREMHDCGVEELGVFYIGESFTCKWLPEAILEAKNVGFPYVFLTTNGSAATPKNVEACMEAGLDSLKFSMNYYSAEQLGEVAQVSPRMWEKSIHNLKEARRVRDGGNFPCRIYASSIAFDGEQGEKMRELVKEITPYVDEHYWLPLYGMGGASKSIGWVPKPGNPGRLDAMRDPLPCWAVFTEGHITKDGYLAACCFGSGIDGDLLMADLNEVGFMEGWNSLKYQELRQAHLNKDVSKTACATCAAG